MNDRPNMVFCRFAHRASDLLRGAVRSRADVTGALTLLENHQQGSALIFVVAAPAGERRAWLDSAPTL
jgi:hypothetical protein